MPIIGNPITQSAFISDTFNGGQTVYSMSVAPANTASVIVAVHGLVQDPSTYAVNGNTLTFTAAPPSGTGNVSARYLGVPASGVVTTAYRTVTDFTATSGQTIFTPPSYTAGFIDVYRNGSKLGAADYTATNGTTVILSTASVAGDLVEIVSFYVSSVLNAIPAQAGAVGSTYLAPSLTLAGTTTASTITSASGTALTLQTNASVTTAITIGTSGAVGIGTTNVLNSSTLSVSDGQIKTNSGYPLAFGTATGGTQDFQLIFQRSAAGSVTSNFSISSVEQNISYRSIILQPNGGTVGVGTTTPSYGTLVINTPNRGDGGTSSIGQLVVAGPISQPGNLAFNTSTAIFRVQGTNATNNLQIGVGDTNNGYSPWIQGAYDNSSTPGGGSFGSKPIYLNPVGGQVLINYPNNSSSYPTGTTAIGNFTNFASSAMTARSPQVGYAAQLMNMTQTTAATNNATVSVFRFLDSNGLQFATSYICGTVYINVIGASGANMSTYVYALAVNGNGTSNFTFTSLANSVRGTNPVSSISISNDGGGGGVQVNVTYINNSGVVTGGGSQVAFVGIAS